MRKHPHKKSVDNSKAFYDAQDEWVSADLVDDLMSTEYAVPPPGILLPEAVWKEKKREELKVQLSTKPFRNRFSHGMDLIAAQLQEHVPRSELKKIQVELAKGTEHVLALMSASPTSPDASGESSEQKGTFRDLMSLSEGTIEQIYQCGVHLTKAQKYQDAADVFFVLSILDHQRHNIWMALGLNEQQLGHLEPALEAYAMAILTDVEDPLPYLHSAECYQSTGQMADAEECLVACTAHVHRLPADQARKMKKSVEKCRAQLQH